MIKNKQIHIISILIIVLVVVGCFFYSQSDKQISKVSSLMDFVDVAAQHLAANGNVALNDFRDQSGNWIKGDSYIFVYDMAGNTIVLPPQADLEGTNRLDTTDINGEKYVKTMADILKIRTYGWNTYQYAKPNNETVATKLSYFKKVESGDKTYIIGSGIYLAK